MTSLEKVQGIARENGRHLGIKAIEVKPGASNDIADFLALHSYACPAVVSDSITYKAAGQSICEKLSSAKIGYRSHVLRPNQNGQVIADEQTVMQLFVEISEETDLLIAVGSGTIHDVVRFVSYKMNKPFISMPTAASVDGFTSRGAPLILRGVKKTIQTASPIAVFADLDILTEAPPEMTAAGFGDILGKYTSLVDWKISHLIGGEPYDSKAAEVTENALKACVAHAGEIARRDSKGIKILMEALIESGLVMLLLGHSRPASGGEHHLSHYWEMDFLRNNRKQLLHGAKVGVTTVIITDLYKRMFNDDEMLGRLSRSKYAEKLAENLEEIQSFIEELPAPEQLRELLKTVGGPTSPEELGVDRDLVKRSFNEAYHLRDRCTGLFLMNQCKSERINLFQR